MNTYKRVAKVLSGMIVVLLFVCGTASADTTVGGVIDIDTTWTLASSPYVVTETITINEATLNIEPGVLVNFNPYQNLNVNPTGVLIIGEGCRFAMVENGITVSEGLLIADGTPERPIVIDRRFPASGWGILTFNNANSQSVLDYCRISGTTSYLIQITNAAPTNPISITNCYLESLQGAGQMIRVVNANPIIANNLIVYNVSNGFAFFIIINNEYMLYPNLSMNSIVRTLPNASSTGIYIEYYGGVGPLVVSKNRVKGFDTGITFFRVGNDTYGSHFAEVEECILHENNISILFRVGNFSPDNSLTIKNNWLRYVSVNWGVSSNVVCTSDSDYWTLPFPARSNLSDTQLICTNERTEPPFPEGDVDNDGDTDRDDALLVGEYLVGNKTLGELPNAADADADGNATIDARDMALIRAFAEGMIWKLPR